MEANRTNFMTSTSARNFFWMNSLEQQTGTERKEAENAQPVLSELTLHEKPSAEILRCYVSHLGTYRKSKRSMTL